MPSSWMNAKHGVVRAVRQAFQPDKCAIVHFAPLMAFSGAFRIEQSSIHFLAVVSAWKGSPLKVGIS